MIKLRLLAVGKTREEWIRHGLLRYLRMLRKYARIEVVELKEEKAVGSRSTQAILEAEGGRILENLKGKGGTSSSNLSIALDKEGQEVSSEKLARLLQQNMNKGISEFVFILGGPLGLSPEVLRFCNLRLSLSQMTFTHEMSRIILLEQLYRALSILHGSDYHK